MSWWRTGATAFLSLLAGGAAAPAGQLDYNFAGLGKVSAIEALVRRTLKLSDEQSFPFEFEMVDRCTGGEKPDTSESDLCFELSQKGSATLVRGTSAIDMAYGVGFYLREYCNMSFAWSRSGGNHVVLPPHWPSLESQPVVRWRLRDISYGFNVCTESYSQPWYTFDDPVAEGGFGDNWENFLDWSALSGINLALAYTGQEEVYRKVYNQFGVNDSVFAEWSNGPAHLTWSRGQSMHGVGGPIPESWMKAQWHLQRQILGRMREIGMTPILPAFQGNVPPLMASLNPEANISLQSAHWGGGSAAWLDATDPLFQKIGDALMKELIADFGIDIDGDGNGDVTEHWYEADGYFASGDPPWRRLSEGSPPATARRGGARSYDQDNTYEDAYVHALHAYRAMSSTDPDAIWMYQGWILDPTQHSLEVMQGYRAAVPQGRFLVSDMWAEWRPITAMLAQADVPYLYGTLQNFGGGLFLGMSTIALNDGAPEDPLAVPSMFDTFAQRAGAVGVGAFPEGIDQNPAYYTYLFDAPWMASPVADMDSWWAKYALQRYGAFSESAAAAWETLGRSVYGIDVRQNASEGGEFREKKTGGLSSAPFMHYTGDEPSHVPGWYNLSVVFGAWELLVAAADELPSAMSSTLRYDLANVGREVLEKINDVRYTDLMAATDAPTVAERAELVTSLQADADALLCTDASLSVSSWIQAAAACGDSDGRSDFYNRMARAQVTTWLPACEDRAEFASGVCSIHVKDAKPPLDDYAAKSWGGLVEHFYAGRIRCYADEWEAHPVAETYNVTAYDACLDDLARDFQYDFDMSKYPICQAPQGDVLSISRSLISKYREEVRKISSLFPVTTLFV